MPTSVLLVAGLDAGAERPTWMDRDRYGVITEILQAFLPNSFWGIWHDHEAPSMKWFLVLDLLF